MRDCGRFEMPGDGCEDCGSSRRRFELRDYSAGLLPWREKAEFLRYRYGSGEPVEPANRLQ